MHMRRGTHKIKQEVTRTLRPRTGWVNLTLGQCINRHGSTSQTQETNNEIQRHKEGEQGTQREGETRRAGETKGTEKKEMTPMTDTTRQQD